MSQVAGDGVTEVSVQFLGVTIFSTVFSRKIPPCRKILGTCDSLDTLQFFSSLFYFFHFSFCVVELLRVLLSRSKRIGNVDVISANAMLISDAF